MRKRIYSLSAFLLAFVLLFSTAGCSGAEPSEEERRQIYAENREYANWLLKLPVRGSIAYSPLEFVVSRYRNAQAPPLSVFRVDSIEEYEGEPDCLLVKATIEEVLCGREDYLGRQIKLLYGTGRLEYYPDMKANPQIMVGRRAIGCFSGEDGEYGVYPFMAFYLTEDNRLVHALGATEEDVLSIVREIPEHYLGSKRFGYYYTGKTLEDFKADIAVCLAELEQSDS